MSSIDAMARDAAYAKSLRDRYALGPSERRGDGGAAARAAAARARAEAAAKARAALAEYRRQMQLKRLEALERQRAQILEKQRLERERLRENDANLQRERLTRQIANETDSSKIAGLRDQLAGLQGRESTRDSPFLPQLKEELRKFDLQHGDDLKRLHGMRREMQGHDKAWQKQVAFMASDKGKKAMKDRAKRLGINLSDAQLESGRISPVVVVALMDAEDGKLSEEQAARIKAAQTRVEKVALNAPTGSTVGPLGVTNPDGSLSVGFGKKDRKYAGLEKFGPEADYSARVSAASDLYRTANPFFAPGNIEGTGYDDAVLMLSGDEDIRFVDSKGNKRNKNGKLYTFDDYVNGEIRLDIDEDSLNMLVGKQPDLSTPALKAIKGETVTKTGTVTMSGVDTFWYFVQMSKNDPAKFTEFQSRLDAADFFGGDAFVAGKFDPATQAALSQFLGYAGTYGSAANLTFDELLYDLRDRKEITEGWGGGGFGGGGGGGGASAWAVTDEVALQQVADMAGKTLLGRNLTESERAQVVGQIKTLENAEGQKQSGAIQSIDPQARAEDIVRNMFPNDSKAHDMAGAFDMFAGILDAGLGLGSGGFGQSSIPTGTGGPTAPTGGAAPMSN